ncbi:MAG: hypothetical protein LAO20_08085 [Acidobacteriia bacterium]|nr:hypothetical protein [Terriglobia bacterium]
MKLIQILALTAAMATMATAQNAGKSPAPAATPVKSPAAAAGKPQPAGQPPASKKPAASAPAGAAKGAAAKPAATPATAGKPAGTAPAASKTGPAPQIVAKPSPVPATKAGKKPAIVATAPAKKKKSAKGQTAATKKPATGQPKVAETAQPEKKKPAQRLMGAAGRRDPFVSPIRGIEGPRGPLPGCNTGKRCLNIPELVLRGTVRDISGKMLAVVSNSVQKTYTLRENDQVFNGSVEKITSDSIVFREFVKDALGRETAREVVKKMTPPS